MHQHVSSEGDGPDTTAGPLPGPSRTGAGKLPGAGTARWGRGRPGGPRRRRRAPLGGLAVLAGVGVLALVPARAGAQANGTFSTTGALSTARAEATATRLSNGDVLVVGGEDAAGTPLSSAEIFDPSTGSWHAAAAAPLGVARASAVRLSNGDVLVVGGLTGTAASPTPTGATETYDPTTNTWASAGTLPGGLALYGAAAVRLQDNTVLVAGGWTGTGPSRATTDKAATYDGSWRAAAPMPVSLADAAIGAQGDTALVAGGLTKTASGGASVSGSAATFDATSGTWAGAQGLATPVADAAAVTLSNGGGLLVAGGETSPTGAASAVSQLFDPSTGTWTVTGSLPFASYGATGVALGSGGALYAGGLSSPGAPTRAAATYDPSAKRWSSTGALVEATGFAASAVLSSGKVLVAGGATGTAAVTATTQLFAAGSAPKTSPARFTSPARLAVRGGVPVDATITTSGSPPAVVHERGALPPGLRFVTGPNGTARIFGTPAVRASGTYRLTLTASNGVGASAVQRFVITAVARIAARITSPASVTFAPGRYDHFAVTSSGSPAPRLQVTGTLPKGVRFRPGRMGRGSIDGRPDPGTAGTYHLVVTAVNGIGHPAEQRLVLTVGKAVAITTPASRRLKAGASVRFALKATGAPAPKLSLSGTLPPGLSVVQRVPGELVIAGKTRPDKPGRYAVRVVATNGLGKPARQRLELVVVVVGPPPPRGYWYVTSTGELVAKGAARPIRPRVPQHPRAIVAMAATPSKGGYYLVSSFGGVFPYGKARFYGSLARARPATPVVGVGVTAGDRGYWLVTAGGRVFGFGNARYFGSLAHRHVRVVAFAATANGKGYWLVTRTGRVFGFGAAQVYGSLADRRVPPVVGAAATANGKGYWLVTRAGNVFGFGDARFFGSSAHRHLRGAVTGFAAFS